MMQSYSNINIKRILGEGYSTNHSLLWSVKKNMDKCLYLNDEKIIFELRKCALQLEEGIKDIENKEKPVILAPMHMVSDVLVSVMCGFISSKETLVISTHKDDLLGINEEQSLNNMGVNLKKIDPAEINTGSLRTVIRSVKTQETYLVIFPDAPPEVTLSLTGKSMRTMDCTLFGKPARLHSGLKELARLCNAQVIFFGLSHQGNALSLTVFGVADAKELSYRTPYFIEKALRAHSKDWLLWYTPSFFYFNDKSNANE